MFSCQPFSHLIIACSIIGVGFSTRVHGDGPQTSEFIGSWSLVSQHRGSSKLVATPTNLEISEGSMRFSTGKESSRTFLESAFVIENAAPPYRLRLESGAHVMLSVDGNELQIYSASEGEKLPESIAEPLSATVILRTFTRLPSEKNRIDQTTVSELDSAMINAIAYQDERAGRDRLIELKTEKRLRGLPSVLSSLEIEELLTLDHSQVNLHHQLLGDLMSQDQKLLQTPWFAEKCHQQQARLSDLDCSPEQEKEQLLWSKRLGARQVDAPAGIQDRAKTAFDSKLAIYLEPISDEPLEFSGGIGLKKLKLPLWYSRHPEVPPCGCRIVAKVVVKRGERNMVISHYTGYRSTAHDIGMTQGKFIAMGQLPELVEPRLFIYATPLNPENPLGQIPISNIVSLPLKWGETKDDMPMLVTSELKGESDLIEKN